MRGGQSSGDGLSPEESEIRLIHEMIRASAGSGKTHQLAIRYVRLLALGVPVESIIALTFTRKAAGEFFARIAETLAQSALDESRAEGLAGQAGIPDWNTSLAGEVLRNFVWSTPSVHLGTMDQFFHKVLTQFAFEYGLPTGFAVADPGNMGMEINKILSRLLQPRQTGASARVLMEALKEASYGNESSTVTQLLIQRIDKFHALYLECPREDVWGHSDAIWETHPFSSPSPEEFEKNLDYFREFLIHHSTSDAKMERWETLFQMIRDFDPMVDMPASLDTLLKNVQAMLDEFRTSERGSLTFFRKPPLEFTESSEVSLLMRVLAPVVSRSWEVKFRQTRGVYQLISEYESLYDFMVRRAGVLTFSDLLYLLSPKSGAVSGAARPVLSQRLGDDRRLNIDFRLDSRFDHWLLDEFQDTSRIQWSILENLIDEVVQDESGTRSLFVVGDIKQSIYGWRGGDHRLFEFLSNRYAQYDGQGLVQSSLDFSFRSGPAIIDFVNAMFTPSRFIGPVLGVEVAGQWDWVEHKSARPELACHVAVLSPVEAEKLHPSSESISPERLDLIVGLLEETDPVARGMSCAVLVRSNKEARNVTNHLRAAGIPVTLAVDIHIAHDNLIVPAMVSLIQALVHPEDTFARHHFLMSPLADCDPLARRDWGEFAGKCLGHILESGPAQWSASWLARLKNSGTSLDRFHLRRFDQFIDAAREFESSNNDSLDAFLDFIDVYTIQEPGNISQIQVLTIHKSKGLGFDMVLLPQLNVKLHYSLRESLLVHRQPDGSIAWVTDTPRKNIAELDAGIASIRADQNALQTFQELCLYYVASTRAKRALYFITDPRENLPFNPQDNTTVKYHDLLFQILDKSQLATNEAQIRQLGHTQAAIHFEDGNLEFLPPVQGNYIPELPPQASPASQLDLFNSESTRQVDAAQRLVRQLPSQSDSSRSGTLSAAGLFSRDAQRARQMGTFVHQLLEAIEWLKSGEDIPQQVHQLWASRGYDKSPVFGPASAAVLGFLENPGNLAHFLHLGSTSDKVIVLWREKPFEMVSGNKWYSGIIDRAHIAMDQKGNPSAASLLEFKTDRHFDPSRYVDQTRIYTQAVSRILRIPEDKIELHILNIPVR